jgi:hypothetical protein
MTFKSFSKIRIASAAKIPLFFLLAFLLASAALHKFYVSKTTILFNERTQQFEITCKFFTDDFENALAKGRVDLLHLGQENESSSVNSLIETYVNNHFRITIDNQVIAYRFVGKEVESDLTYVYLEFYRVPQFYSMKIENTFLIDQFPEQQNIVDLSINSTTQTLILMRDKTTDLFSR